MVIDKERITDRFTDNATEFDQIVIDTFKIIEEKDKSIQELAEAATALLKMQAWRTEPSEFNKLWDDLEALAKKHLKGEK